MKIKMMKALLTLFLCSFALLKGNAQTLQSATKQDWAGGISEVSGTNYVVEALLNNKCFDCKLEAVWLKGYGKVEGASLQLAENGTGGNQVTIHFGTRSGTYDLINDINPVDHHQDKMPEFTGECLIIIRSGLRSFEIEVENFLELPMVAYP